MKDTLSKQDRQFLIKLSAEVSKLSALVKKHEVTIKTLVQKNPPPTTINIHTDKVLVQSTPSK